MSDCHTRLPFRFGASTMRQAPLCLLRAEIETDAGVKAVGFSSDLLVPKWFDKNPDTTTRHDLDNLLNSVRQAAAAASDTHMTPGTVFQLWRRVYQTCAGVHGAPLVNGFGAALIERAVIDAACRAADQPFFDALKTDLFGFEPGAMLAELAGWNPSETLPAAPSETVKVRHTIGLLDALRAGDLAPADRVNDGLPQSLEEDIERYKLDHFKIKLSGDAEFDTQRVIRIAEILQSAVSGPPRITLDGNEQFDTLDDLTATLARVAKSAAGRALLDGLLYIEQPLPRRHTFDPRRNAAMKSLEAFAAALIDEADADLHAFKRAVELGYRGVSVKNCKGVFRALLNFGLCAQSGGELFQSSEDLTNLPVVALQQDLATVAALGLTHAERNGHHYFAGLAHLPDSEVRAAAESHPDLYETRDEAVSLKIHDGALSIGSLQCPGYGYAVPIDVIQRTPLAHWRYPEAE